MDGRAYCIARIASLKCTDVFDYEEYLLFLIIFCGLVFSSQISMVLLPFRLSIPTEIMITIIWRTKLLSVPEVCPRPAFRKITSKMI